LRVRSGIVCNGRSRCRVLAIGCDTLWRGRLIAGKFGAEFFGRFAGLVRRQSGIGEAGTSFRWHELRQGRVVLPNFFRTNRRHAEDADSEENFQSKNTHGTLPFSPGDFT
jgi:hypothetical protein